jgi:hypothetical protein
MEQGLLGMIATPNQGNTLTASGPWCGDNNAFGGKYPGDVAFLRWMRSYGPRQRERCLFVVAPDVVADAAATLERSAPWLPVIRAEGYPVAFVAQDGLEDLTVPWDDFDVLFIGGSTEWKLGAAARRLVADAKARSKWVHMGRVNSHQRLRYAAAIGCDSADGTYLTFGPDRNLGRLLGWLREVNGQGALFGGAA